MKITIDIDCTPQEARTFLGLPDVTALQTRMLKDYEQRLTEAMNNMDPQTVVATMMKGMPDGFPGNIPGSHSDDMMGNITNMQQTFWSNMMTMAGQPSDKPDDT